MGYAESYNLEGNFIKTTVSADCSVVKDHISRFEYQGNGYSCMTKCFGFDTDWRSIRSAGYNYNNNYICAISICDGNSCLVFPLTGSGNSVIQSLSNFLSHPSYTFVGVGVKDNVSELKKKFGIRCRNVVELAPWAARVLHKPHLTYCGVDELAFNVCRLALRNHRPLSTDFDGWGQGELDRKLVKHATINVFSYQMIGTELFRRDL